MVILSLTAEQQADQAVFKAFVDDHIVPNADRWDRDQALQTEVIQKLAAQRYLIATLPREAGGSGMDAFTYGLFTEEIGRGCASIRNLLGVSGMVAHAILRWGNKTQKERWLHRLGSGELTGAFALTEPQVGTDAAHITTTATLSGNTYLIEGCKKWISFGQTADIFLVIAQCEGKPTAFLVERNTPGLSVRALQGLLGLRASRLAELQFDKCSVPTENLIGAIGSGFAWVASFALDYGRYSTACGCVGLAQACLDASRLYTQQRSQFGVLLKDHQLIQRMITNMVANIAAGRLLCWQAAHFRDLGDPDAIRSTLIAKYFTSTMLGQITSDAVQVHGANGCSEDHSVQRYFRDAKVMEIIEGTTQIHQVKIAGFA